MSKRLLNVLAGAGLILLGGFFLLVTFDVVPDLSIYVMALGFGLVGILFLIGYLLRGARAWPLLFPALLPLALAAVILLAEWGVEGTIVGGLFMAAVALPFYAAYLSQRQENLWALIPAWALTVVTGVIFFADIIPGEVLGAAIMVGIGLPFFFVFLRNREHWWALIPAGILTTIGFITLLAATPVPDVWDGRLMAFLFFAGAAVPFILLWAIRSSYPTAWARYPAVILLGFGTLILVVGEWMEKAWPAAVILFGIWLLFDSTRGEKSPPDSEGPQPAIKP